MRFAILGALLALGAQTAPEGSIAGDLAVLPDDVAAMAAGGADVARAGAVLTVGKRSYRDRGTCEGFYSCRRWRLDRALGQGWYGVSISYGEAHGYRLVNARTGREADVGGRPVLSPDGARFAVAGEDAAQSGSLRGVEVWQLTPTFTRPLFRHALGDESAIPGVAGWRGPDCVEFRWDTGQGDPSDWRFVYRRGHVWDMAARPGPPCAMAET